ncbi:SusE domain-containing protein [Flavobacterium pectinovorum]|uniref:SusE domain-containing protein n=1 Tax=Flavobacterium pectinovorum TaxID=29533 RepID=UPI001FAD2A4A|nr:SusE domain-containing protein [Flavobacterium pectinovorum]MCI9846215.1 SusE domain-containing protein [Flavobacterium pectinovorum]
MKNIYKIFIAVAMLTGLWSCENEENLMIAEPQEAAFSIVTPEAGSSTILNKDTPNNTALTVTWEKVNYGAPTTITYTVQFATTDTEFSAPVDITSAAATHATITVAELNAKALELGLEPGVEGSIDLRIKSTIGTTGSEPKFSDIITILVTPYEGVTPAIDLYLIGDGTADGWNISNNLMPIFRDPADNAKHYYTGYLNSGGFKLVEQIGFWAPAYGSNGDKVQYRATESDADPSAFPTTAPGYYSFEINTKDLTYKIAPFSGTLPNYTTVGIIGDAAPLDNWGTSVAMTKSTFNPHIWKITYTFTTDGKFKFLADTNWIGDSAGADIQVKAGKYNIWFNDIDNRYTLIAIP